MFCKVHDFSENNNGKEVHIIRDAATFRLFINMPKAYFSKSRPNLPAIILVILFSTFPYFFILAQVQKVNVRTSDALYVVEHYDVGTSRDGFVCLVFVAHFDVQEKRKATHFVCTRELRGGRYCSPVTPVMS